MARKRYTAETIIRKLREAEVLQGQGKTVAVSGTNPTSAIGWKPT